MSSSVQRWLRAKQGPACPGWILEPETPTLLLHLGGSLPDQVFDMERPVVPTSNPPVSWCSSGHVCTSNATLGLCCPSASLARHGTHLKRATVSYLWCDHPGGRPCPAGAIYCLIYLLRFLPPSNHLLQAPGVQERLGGWAGCSVHRPHPDFLHLEEVPNPRVCGRKNLYSG